MPAPTFIDLFSGCGGLSLGLLKAGWKGLFAVERSSDAFLTYKHNLIDSERFEYQWPAWLPKENHDIETLISNYSDQLRTIQGSVDLIVGGPPCQGFSVAGKRNPKDPRNRMAEHYIDIVRILKPRFLLMENVKGFDTPFKTKTKSKKKKTIPYSQVIKKSLEKEGYTVSYRVIKSADWGVPQLRPRFILIASRKDLNLTWQPFIEFELSRSSFLEQRGLSENTHQTTHDAISDLQVSGKELVENTDGGVKGFKRINYQEPEQPTAFIKLMRQGVPENHTPNSLRLPRHRPEIIDRFSKIIEECEKGRTLSVEQRAKYGLKKHSTTPLCPNRPSATMTTLPDDFLHYSEPRVLTVREMARIQSFPDWFEFLGQYTTGGKQRKSSCPRYTQVGNAVPPMLGEALGELIYSVANPIEEPAQEEAA